MSELGHLFRSRQAVFSGIGCWMFNQNFFDIADVCELEVSMRDIEPRIWRAVRVPADLTLARLHEVLQVAFGWTDSHLHDFVARGIRFGMIDADDEIFSVDEEAAPLGAVVDPGESLLYRYDFGDDWEHDIVVKRVTDGRQDAFVCTAGARACPPEDCGGAHGYAEMLAILAKPAHSEHREIRTWVGRRFDPEKFDRESVNKKLAKLAKPWLRAERASVMRQARSLGGSSSTARGR
jgi:hypothetical protein